MPDCLRVHDNINLYTFARVCPFSNNNNNIKKADGQIEQTQNSHFCQDNSLQISCGSCLPFTTISSLFCFICLGW